MQQGYMSLLSEFILQKILTIYLKVKRESSPCALTEYHAMKAYWGVEVQLHALFDLGIRWK
jgi:hypothetical protein